MPSTQLKRWLKREGITSRELWRRINKRYKVSEPRVNHVVLGERPSPDLANAIAKVTGISRDDLIYKTKSSKVRRALRKGFRTGPIPKERP